uniref:BRO1 domain-containing protein n=1 Tax=Globodera rostochiensis TaxID=31243 RepID=A0A914GYL8_GLORO
MVNFLSVPLKTTNEVDLYKPLKSYIDSLSELTDELRIESNEGLTELNKLRNRACCQPLDKHQSSLDVITRYYDQLCAMEAKLPITPTQNPVSFKWKDAFDKGSLFFSRASLTLNDSSFERACVLFNCGALMSTIASNQQTHTDEELKTMARLFQQSAGVFSRLKDTVLALVQQEPTTSDLLPDTLTALVAMMVAQAQEAIYIKAEKDKIKPASLLKIAAQCADFYQDAQKLMNREAVKRIWDKEWTQSVAGKGLVFASLAQFHAAETSLEEHKYGEQAYLPNAFLEESALVKKELERATRDNDFIYHERVPDFKTLPLLPKAPLAKPNVTFPLSTRFKDLFESLVPVSVQNALSTFEARRSEVINIDVGRMREYTQLMNACLASMNLPAALDDVTKQEQCPESIREKSAKVKNNGGISAMSAKINELPLLYKRNDEILNETSRIIKEEKENDDGLRVQFQSKWTRVPSDRLTAPLLQELGKYRGIMHTASNSDALVRNKFEANRRGIELLSMTENDLRTAIPGIGANKGNANSPTVNTLRNLLDQSQEIKVEREGIEKELKKIRCDMSNEFAKALTQNGVINEEKMSSEKIHELFKPLKDSIDKSIKRQETVMAEVERWSKRFLEERHTAGGAERENLLKQLATSYDAFIEIHSNLNEGMKFYNDLTANLIRLQQKVSDFCFARQTEKEDLMKQVQQNIVSGGTGTAAVTSTKSPPPRPPPPNTVAAQPASVQQTTYQSPQIPSQNFVPLQNQGQPMLQYQQQQQPNQYTPYAPYPFGVPPSSQPSPYTPYPMQYPGTYPGAYPQQQYGAYPPQPFVAQQQQNAGNSAGTNPFNQQCLLRESFCQQLVFCGIVPCLLLIYPATAINSGSVPQPNHDFTVLKSYTLFVMNMCQMLDIHFSSRDRALMNTDHSKVNRPKYKRWIQWLLRSKFVKKKYKLHYETRTYLMEFDVHHLTGSTASAFLEYIERNTPEGVALKVTYTEMCFLPETIVRLTDGMDNTK